MFTQEDGFGCPPLKQTNMTATKKIIIKHLKPLPKKHLRILSKERKLRVNLTRNEVLFFREKWLKKTTCQSVASFVHFLNLYGDKGIEATILLKDFPKGHIRSIRAVSNSKLTGLKERLQGKSHQPIGRKGVFGAAFHELILEPAIYQPDVFNLRPSEMERLQEMKKAIDRDSLTQKILQKAGPHLETTRVWRDPITRLKCKGKLDIEIPQLQEAVDLKTTSAKSQAEFEETLRVYDYDRQGAFYSEGAQAKKFRFIAVQKIYPFNVYHFAFDRDSDFMKTGRRKANFLLRKYKELQE